MTGIIPDGNMLPTVAAVEVALNVILRSVFVLVAFNGIHSPWLDEVESILNVDVAAELTKSPPAVVTLAFPTAKPLGNRVPTAPKAFTCLDKLLSLLSTLMPINIETTAITVTTAIAIHKFLFDFMNVCG